MSEEQNYVTCFKCIHRNTHNCHIDKFVTFNSPEDANIFHKRIKEEGIEFIYKKFTDDFGCNLGKKRLIYMDTRI